MQQNRRFYHPRHWATWLGYGILWLVVQLPHPLRMAIGSALGMVGYRLAAGRRHVVETNLRLCFPQLTDHERVVLARDIFRSGGMSIVETAISWIAGGSSVLDRSVIEGQDNLNRALAKGKGAILMGTHMATLDIAGAIMSSEFTLDVMYRANKNELLEYLMTSGRGRLFSNEIERGDVRQVIRNLKAGHIVWYGPDQDYGPRNSVFVPFFGVPAATTTATSRIAKIAGAPVVPFTHYRVGNNTRYRILIFPPWEDFPSGVPEQDAKRINEFVEACVKERPEQYWWFHRRFKTRPPGEPGVY